MPVATVKRALEIKAGLDHRSRHAIFILGTTEGEPEDAAEYPFVGFPM